MSIYASYYNDQGSNTTYWMTVRDIQTMIFDLRERVQELDARFINSLNPLTFAHAATINRGTFIPRMAADSRNSLVTADFFARLSTSTVEGISALWLNSMADQMVPEFFMSGVYRELRTEYIYSDGSGGGFVSRWHNIYWEEASGGGTLGSRLPATFLNKLSPSTVSELNINFMNNLSPQMTRHLNAQFLNNLSSEVFDSLSASFFSEINLSIFSQLESRYTTRLMPLLTAEKLNRSSLNEIGGLTEDVFNSLDGGVIRDLSTSCIENMVQSGNINWTNLKVHVWRTFNVEAVRGVRNFYWPLLFMHDVHIQSLRVTFLNSLSQDTINMMINTPSNWAQFAGRIPSYKQTLLAQNLYNVADKIPTAQKIVLDSVKYRVLIQRVTIEEFNNLARNAQVMNTIRLDVLDILSNQTIAGLNSNFVNSLPDTLIQAMNNNAVAGARFLNALSSDVASSLTANFLSSLNREVVNRLNFFNFPPETISNLSANFFNAMSPTLVANSMGYAALNCISDANIALLNLNFLNAINEGSVELMIYNNWNVHVRPNGSFASHIPKNKWLGLDGGKYSGLLGSIDQADLSILTSIDSSKVRADALNALPENLISRIPSTFLMSLPVYVRNSLSREFLGAVFPGENLSHLEAANIEEVVAWFINMPVINIQVMNNNVVASARFLNALSSDATSSLTANFLNSLNREVVNRLNFFNFPPETISNLSANFFNAMSSTLVANSMGYGALNCISDANIALLNLNFLNAINEGSVELMIYNNWNVHVRPNGSFASHIPKNKWLGLDGGKYSALLRGVTQADFSILRSIDLSKVRADALNALPEDIGARFLNALSSDVTSSLTANFLNSLSSEIVSRLNFFNFPAATISNLSANYFNAMPSSLVVRMLPSELIYISDESVALLNLNFLNSIYADNVRFMMYNDLNLYVRPNGSFASHIPKNKWLGLDGRKYSDLLGSIDQADLSILTSIDSSQVRADALNALPENLISRIPSTFLMSLPVYVRDSLRREFLGTSFSAENLSHLEEVSTERAESSFIDLSQLIINNDFQDEISTIDVIQGDVIQGDVIQGDVIQGDVIQGDFGTIYRILIQEIVQTDQSYEATSALSTSLTNVGINPLTPNFFRII